MATILVDKDYQFTIERQVTWGTAIDSAPIGLGWKELSITQDPDIHTIDRMLGYRGTSQSQRFNNTFSSYAKLSGGGVVAPALLKSILGGMLQKSADYTPSSSVYTMQTNAYATLPSPSAGEGYFYTMTARSPAASKSWQAKNCIPTNFKFTLHPTENDGMLYLSSDWIGVGFTRTANPSGTVTNVDLTNYYTWSGLSSFLYNAVEFITDFYSMEINISLGAKFQGDIPTRNVVFPEAVVKGNFKVWANANTETLKGYVDSKAIDTALLLKPIWGDGTVTTAGEMNWLSYTYLDKYDDSNKKEGELIQFDFTGHYASSSLYPFQAVFYAA